MPALGRAPVRGSCVEDDCHGAGLPSEASASARPVSVSEYVFLPADSVAVMRPSSASSCRVGYTEPGLGFHEPSLRSSISWMIW